MTLTFMNRYELPGWAGALKRPILLSIKAALVAAVGLFFWPTQYRSEARVLPAAGQDLGSLSGLAGAAAAVGMNVPMSLGGSGLEDSQLDILNSRWVMEQLLKATYVYHERPWYLGPWGPRREVRGTLYDYWGKANMDKALDKLDSKYDVSQDQKTKLITLTIETGSPDLSQQVARKAVKLLEEFLSTNARTRGGEKAVFTQARLEEARKGVEKAETAYRNFLASHLNNQTSLDPDTRVQSDALSAELQLRRQLMSTLAVNYENCLLEEKNDVPILNVLDAGHLPEEHSKPKRGLLLVAAMVLAAVAGWAKDNWAWIREQMGKDEDE